MTKRCHCGLELHYTNKVLEQQMNEIIEKFGAYIEIQQIETGKRYRVQRHYIALHGVKGKDLGKLGFKEVIV